MAKIVRPVPAPPLIGVEPNPGPRKSQRLSEEERWRVIHLSTELHLSNRNIAKRMGVARNTVADLLKKYHQIGSVEERAGRGRKRRITEAHEKKVVKKAKQGKDSTEIAREIEVETGINVHETTIQRYLKKHNLRYLVREQEEEISEENLAHRLSYAREMKGYNWKKVFFSDEKTFQLSSEKSHAWQEPGKRKKHYFKRHPPKVHVWAAAGAYMKSKLYFFRETLKSPLYQKILSKRLGEDDITFSPDAPVRISENWVFLQDNDPKHKAKKTMTLLEELVDDRIIEHPAQSPDLNIMEDLWSYLDRKVKASKIESISGLKHKLSMLWDAMSWSEIRTSVGSMAARLAECEEVHGARTHY